jgi:LysM repeat protein
MDSTFNLGLAIDQACDEAQRFLDKLRKNKPMEGDPRMGDVRLLDAFLRQIPTPELPDRPIGAMPLKGLGYGVVKPGDDLISPKPNTAVMMEVRNALQPLLKLIYSGEGGYDSYNRGKAGDSPGPWPGGLQVLTIAEIMKLQQQGKISAVGAPQFIPETLKIALRDSGLEPSDLFNAANQDRLAIALLLGTKRPKLASYLRGKTNDLDSAHTDLAHEWASVPLPSGVGHFDGDASGNLAKLNVNAVRNTLQSSQQALVNVLKNHTDFDLLVEPITDHHPGTSERFNKPSIKAFIQSPNFSSRNNANINTIIVHYTTSGNVNSTISHFQNPAPEGDPQKAVSAHYIIDKNGDIYQMVSDADKAWHAEKANASSIGIEHVAELGDQLTQAQENASIQLIKWLMSEYKIAKESIKAHKEILSTKCPANLFGDAADDPRLPKFKQWVAKNFSNLSPVASQGGGVGPSGLGIYIVQAGDSLSMIADSHNTTIGELLALNPSIKNPNLIFPGQAITVARVEGDEAFISSNSHALLLPVVIAEHQLDDKTYQDFAHPILGKITVTGGYMEPHGHAPKPRTKAIFLNGELKNLPESDRNIGIDYVVSDRRVKAWYGGKVTRQGREGGYGRRIHIQLDIMFEFQGKKLQVYQAYAHLQEIRVSLGQVVVQGQQIGVMGGSGASSDADYAPHVDLSTYVFLNKELIQVNPQALDRQLA